MSHLNQSSLLYPFVWLKKQYITYWTPPNYSSLESLWNSNGSTENHRCQQVLVDISVRASEIRHSWLGNPLKMKEFSWENDGEIICTCGIVHCHGWQKIPGPHQAKAWKTLWIERAIFFCEQQSHTPKILAKHIWSSDKIGRKNAVKSQFFYVSGSVGVISKHIHLYKYGWLVKTNSTPSVHIKIAGLKWMWITH